MESALFCANARYSFFGFRPFRSLDNEMRGWFINSCRERYVARGARREARSMSPHPGSRGQARAIREKTSASLPQVYCERDACISKSWKVSFTRYSNWKSNKVYFDMHFPLFPFLERLLEFIHTCVFLFISCFSSSPRLNSLSLY